MLPPGASCSLPHPSAGGLPPEAGRPRSSLGPCPPAHCHGGSKRTARCALPRSDPTMQAWVPSSSRWARGGREKSPSQRRGKRLTGTLRRAVAGPSGSNQAVMQRPGHHAVAVPRGSLPAPKVPPTVIWPSISDRLVKGVPCLPNGEEHHPALGTTRAISVFTIKSNSELHRISSSQLPCSSSAGFSYTTRPASQALVDDCHWN